MEGGSGDLELKSLPESKFKDEVSDMDSESELIFMDKAAEAKSTQGLAEKVKLLTQRLKTCDGEATGGGQNALKKELNLFSLTAYIVGTIIGSGIFITPRTILCLTGSFGVSLIMWLIGGVIAIGGGLCYIELGLLIRKSGGEYSFIKEAYSFKKKLRVLGSLLGFVYTWSSLTVIRPTSLAIITLTSARYLIRPFYIGCDNIPESAVKLIALATLILLGVINCRGLSLAAKLMSLLLVTKILIVLFVIILGVAYMIRVQTFPESFTHPFEVSLPGHKLSLSLISLSLYSVVWAYDGWSTIGYTAEETKSVQRNLPLSLFIGVPVVIVSYLLVNISFFAVLDLEQILSAKAVALPFGKLVMGTAGLVVFPLLVAVSTFGTANGTLFIGTRVTYVSAREGHLPDFLSGLHVTAKTPVPAIVVLVTLAGVMVIIGDIEQLIDGFSSINLVIYGMTTAAVVILRVTHQKEQRLFKVWFIVPVAIAMSCLCIFLVLVPLFASNGGSDIVGPLLALSLTLLGVPVYIFLAMEHPWKLRPKFVDKLSEHLAVFTNNIFNTQSTREPPSAEAKQ